MTGRSGGARSGDPLLLASALGGLLEQLVNTALNLDAVSQARMAQLDGKVLRIHCTSPALATDLRFTTEGVRLRGVPDDQLQLGLEAAGVDTLLRGPASALISLLTSADSSAEALLSSGVQVSGDANLAAELANIAANIEPDLESPLEPLVGSRNAMLIGTAAKGFADLLRSAAGGAKRQADAALHRVGTAALANPAEVQRFLDEVDDLSAATDRLAARVRNLQGPQA